MLELISRIIFPVYVLVDVFLALRIDSKNNKHLFGQLVIGGGVILLFALIFNYGSYATRELLKRDCVWQSYFNLVEVTASLVGYNLMKILVARQEKDLAKWRQTGFGKVFSHYCRYIIGAFLFYFVTALLIYKLNGC